MATGGLAVNEVPASAPQRLGLALSGGGFRASFFHIGVLARLADLDVLRRLHVISTVSGGSILGALYYLELRRRLARAGGPMPKAAYVELVQSIATRFENAVQANLRARTVSNVLKNLWTLRADYSRSDRLAELYWKYFYRPALDGAGARSAEAMSRLGMSAMGGPDPPPVLVLNAASLNTGHRFEFTTHSFGEVVGRSRAPVDKNLLLEPATYDQPRADKYRDLPLSVAVAASSAVPGVFPPLALTDLYDGLTPELVDGGVYENQGLEGLLTDERACTHLIVSDASGQLEDLPRPDPMALSVIMRSPPILMDRVREECYEGLNLRQGRTVRGHVYIHLKHGLPREVRVCQGRQDQGSRTDLAGVDERAGLEVDIDVQRALALIRTDLDAFSEVEAESLMAFGYRLAEHLVPPDFVAPSASSPPRSSWHFLQVERYLRDPSLDPRFLRQLTAARLRIGKPLLVNRWLRWATAAALLAGLALVLAAVVGAWRSGQAARIIDSVARGTLAVVVVVGVAYLVAIMPGKSLRMQTIRRLPLRAMTTALWATVFCAASNLYLLTLNRVFLSHGRVSRLRYPSGSK